MTRPLYPTKLRKGDRIEMEYGWREWDGMQVVAECGAIYSRRKLRLFLHRHLYCRYGLDCSYNEEVCIIEQLVCEGAL